MTIYEIFSCTIKKHVTSELVAGYNARITKNANTPGFKDIHLTHCFEK